MNLDELTRIPAPTPMVISPRTFAAYGALITAVTLTTLYVYRGRAFIVYWIGGWLLFAASLTLLARGYDDTARGWTRACGEDRLDKMSAGVST